MTLRRDVALWASTCLGPLVYLSDLEASYALAGPAKAARSKAALWIVAAVSALLVAGVLAVALRLYRRAGDRPEKFLAGAGLFLSAFSLLLVVAAAVPILVMDPGD